MTKSLEVEVENDRQQVTYVTLTPETVRHLGVSHIGLLFDHAGLKVKPGMRVRIDFTVLP